MIFSYRQLNLTSAAATSLIFGIGALLALTSEYLHSEDNMVYTHQFIILVPFLYLLFLRNGGTFGGGNTNSYSTTHHASQYSSARVW